MRLLLAALLGIYPLTVQAEDFSWRVPTGSGTSLAIPSPVAVENYLRSTWGLEEEELHVCSAALVDVAKDGYYRLIASVDPSGRNFCNEVIVMRKPDHDLHTQAFSVWQVEDIANVLVDLDQDGIPELALPELIYENTKSEAERCSTWTHIYQWKDGNYIHANEKFPDFYKKRYHLLKSTVDTAEHPQCLMKEINNIEALLNKIN